MSAALFIAALGGLLVPDGSPPMRVTQATHRDTSPRLGGLKAILPESVDRDEEAIAVAPNTPAAPAFDRVAQRFHLAGMSASAVRSFAGMGEGLGGRLVSPPDANGDVGLHHYFQMTNFLFAVFSKSGLLLFGPTSDATLWKGFGGPCESADNGDPMAVYDLLSDRWLMSHEAWGQAEGRQCIAVSSTSDPLGPWYRYEFSFPTHNDRATVAVWPSSYVMVTGVPSVGMVVCALDRARMLAGSPASAQCFTLNSIGDVLPADLDGVQQPPAGSPAYVFDLDALDSTLGVFRLSIDWAVPSNSRLSKRSPVPVAPWVAPCAACIPQPGTPQQLSIVPGSIMNRVTYRNFGDHEAFLLGHSADVQGTVGIRWYELRPDSAGSLAVYQQGTFAPDSDHRWMGSAAMDGRGNIAVGYSVASSQVYPSIRTVGRLASDPLGLMTLGEGSLFAGSYAQTWGYRWGDYSAMQVDPIDDCTFWYTTEYAGRFGPGTRIDAFQLPGCAPADTFALEAQPADVKVGPGRSATVKITSRVASGVPRPIDLRIDGLPPGVGASFAASRISAGESTELTLTADAAAPAAQARPFSLEGTAPAFQGYALGQIEVVAAAQSRSGCSSTGVPGGALLMVLVAAALRRRRSFRSRLRAI